MAEGQTPVPVPDYDWLYTQTRAGRERGPEPARALLNRLGAPDRQFASIRVVGTNGKGSTCAMLEAGLLACGVRVGRFTSPHLHAYEERIRMDGKNLDPARTADFVNWAKANAPAEAFFDLTLALACREFAASGVEWAVMEAGVGGVSDATQALSDVRAVALTNADLDHTAALGPTIADIARDKAGAARAGVPFLTTATGEALDVVREVTAKRNAPLYTPATYPELFTLPHDPALVGSHQRHNAALALATLRVLGFEAGAEAALGATHAGRLERFTVGEKTVWIDGAHNPHAARALAQAIPQADVLLFGGLARKDTAATLAPLLEVAPQRVFTAPSELATPPAELAAQYGGQAVGHPTEALAHALALTPADGTLLIAGSLYLAGLLRERVTETKA